MGADRGVDEEEKLNWGFGPERNDLFWEAVEKVENPGAAPASRAVLKSHEQRLCLCIVS
jgi:hypothetical protein